MRDASGKKARRSEVSWHFEQVGPMGGAMGNAYANTLQGSGRPPEEALAREAIQNSCDAAREGNSLVRVVFRIVTLQGRQKDKFLKALALQEGLGGRLESLRLPSPNCLADKSKPLRLAYIEDYGTVGLSGDPHSLHSNFHRLLLSLGESAKAFSVGTGGSYGYGKSALSMNSRLRTVVAYSSFSDQNDNNSSNIRLMGCGYFDSHAYRGKDWTGRAWYGVREDIGGREVVSPIESQAAQSAADSLGFRPRGLGEHGASILLVDCWIDDQKLIRGIEECWWPRIVDQDLQVEVEIDGKSIFPQPRQRKDLLPFIACYSMSVGRSEPLGQHERTSALNRLKGMGLGTYALQLLAIDHADDIHESRYGCIAMIRSPKMVVEYSRLGRSAPPAVGVFVADPEIDEVLKLSEPPAHDRWDADSNRLETAAIGEQLARDVVRAVIERLKGRIRAFQSQATPPRPSEQRRLRLLEHELGALLRPSLHDKPVVPAGATPVEVRFPEEPWADPDGRGNVVTRATVGLRLRQDAEEDGLEAIVRVRIPVLEDDEGTEGELLPVSVASKDIECPSTQDSEHLLDVTLFKKEWISFSLLSAPYDRSWSTKVDIQIYPAGDV